MTAGPAWPGVGRPVYQPAREKSRGTSSVPSGLSPSGPTAAGIPRVGISTRSGAEASRGADEAVQGPVSGGEGGAVAGTRGAGSGGREAAGAGGATGVRGSAVSAGGAGVGRTAGGTGSA